MKPLKVDRTKLKTVKNYADLKGLTPQRIYQLEASGDIKITDIDGVKFVDIS